MAEAEHLGWSVRLRVEEREGTHPSRMRAAQPWASTCSHRRHTFLGRTSMRDAEDGRAQRTFSHACLAHSLHLGRAPRTRAQCELARHHAAPDAGCEVGKHVERERVLARREVQGRTRGCACERLGGVAGIGRPAQIIVGTFGEFFLGMKLHR
jgi:hypothetical protein